MTISPRPTPPDPFYDAVKSGTLAQDYEKWLQYKSDAEAAQVEADARKSAAEAKIAEAGILIKQAAERQIEAETWARNARDEFDTQKHAELLKLDERSKALDERSRTQDVRENELNEREKTILTREDSVTKREDEVKTVEETQTFTAQDLADRTLSLAKKESGLVVREERVKVLEDVSKTLKG